MYAHTTWNMYNTYTRTCTRTCTCTCTLPQKRRYIPKAYSTPTAPTRSSALNSPPWLPTRFPWPRPLALNTPHRRSQHAPLWLPTRLVRLPTRHAVAPNTLSVHARHRILSVSPPAHSYRARHVGFSIRARIRQRRCRRRLRTSTKHRPFSLTPSHPSPPPLGGTRTAHHGSRARYLPAKGLAGC